jgi:hypothetical protein
MAGNVEMKSTIPRTPVASREVVDAFNPRLPNIVGA